VISKKATLHLNLDPELPSIAADSSQLQQLLINLLTNASDAIGDRPGTVHLTTGTQIVAEGELASASPGSNLPGGTYVFVEVADTGCGMDENTVARIFDPFFTTKFTGRGLGLAAVHGIVRGHGGSLRVRSEPGAGTVFRVLFPALTEAIAGRPVAESSPDESWRFGGTVLVVDDEPVIRDLARTMLQDAGATVLTAVDGYDALRQFAHHSGEIGVVLLDLTMPGLDGGEVFQQIHTLDPKAKVILCSGYDEQDVNKRCGPKLPAAFLRKPFTVSDLVRSFRTVV
jgi:CheY-like chemotaxis protein